MLERWILDQIGRTTEALYKPLRLNMRAHLTPSRTWRSITLMINSNTTAPRVAKPNMLEHVL
jgi:hypothetical protein